MVTTPKTKNERIRFLDKDAWYQQVDEQAQRTLGIGADEFIARYKAGEYGDPEENPDVMWLVMLLPTD